MTNSRSEFGQRASRFAAQSLTFLRLRIYGFRALNQTVLELRGRHGNALARSHPYAIQGFPVAHQAI